MHKHILNTGWLMFWLFIVVAAVTAQTETHDGYMGDDVPDDVYPVMLLAGQTVRVSAEAISGNLDTYLLLRDPSGEVIIENDDQDSTTLNAFFTYTATESGQYTVIVSNIQDTSGDYTLSIIIEDESAPESQPGGPLQNLELDAVYTGDVGDDAPDDVYPVRLAAGEALVAVAEATSGDLDTYLVLSNGDGEELVVNDDQDDTTLNSRLVFVPAEAGEFTLAISSYGETAGDYLLEIYIVPAGVALAIERVELSGPVQTYDTASFRIHYTLEGEDAATLEYVEMVAKTLEEVYTIQINRMGWPAPPPDATRGGDSRYDVYLADLINFQGGDLGSASPELPSGDNPNTETTELFAVASYIVMDNDYREVDDADPIAIMRATAAHEFHHAIQFGYDLNEPAGWYYEATAAWMETLTFPKEQDATGYVASVFNYPEVCFGADGDADPAEGLLKYGSWLFMQSLADAHGERVVTELWERIAEVENWGVLDEVLSARDDSIPAAVERYHLQNLVRDYKFTPDFVDETVWLENTIESPGEWTVTGSGIQELAANYFTLALPGDTYSIRVDNKDLRVWVIGVAQDEAEAILVKDGLVVDTSPYREVVVMVFNPAYDDDLTDCLYTNYRLDVQAAAGKPALVTYTLNARQFATLGNE